jgi:hypothetical protein
MKKIKQLLFVLVLLGASALTYGQDDEAYWDSVRTKTVEVIDPVYKPVIGFGFGVMSFYGEVHNNLRSSVMGTPAFKLNVSTFLDKKHMFKTNFVITKGSITGNEHSPTSDTTQNYNFQSDIFSMGLNVHYDFGHWIPDTKKNLIHPFVSIGIENLQFSSKTDLYYNGPDNKPHPYHYWSDGTIRDVGENPYGIGKIIRRDYIYETDLRDLNRNGLGSYTQNTFAIPIDIGIDLKISGRVNLRVGNSWHFTFTDNIDDVSSKATGSYRKGDKRNDMFTFSYFSLHLDLFSSPKELILKSLAQEVDADYAMLDDEDNDGVYDVHDKCPGTPPGVAVDSLGCPYDKDKDGVPDYLDKEPDTPFGAMVNDSGEQIKPDEYGAHIDIEGINRKDVEGFLLMRKAQSRVRGRSSVPIPAKYKSVDADGDNYISFDELVKSINDFFDSPSGLSSKDIYELQDFFFEQ